MRGNKTPYTASPTVPEAPMTLVLTYVDVHGRFVLMKKRTTVWLPTKLLVRLKKLSRKTGAPMAELFRRAVEAYLKRF